MDLGHSVLKRFCSFRTLWETQTGSSYGVIVGSRTWPTWLNFHHDIQGMSKNLPFFEVGSHQCLHLA